MTGTIFDIKRFAVHDGPGIRTTVFLKGCPLRCRWCHNPEGLSSEIVPVPKTRRIGEKHFVETEMVGRRVTPDELMDELRKELIFMEESGGGVTFSGGEPLSQPDFLAEMLRRCRVEGMHTAVDTSGYARPEILEKIIPHTDLFLYDLKFADEEKHLEYTGVSNRPIVKNLFLLSESGCRIQVRIPIIPGVTGTEKNIEKILPLILSLPRPIEGVSLLPYHGTGTHKYKRLGLKYNMDDSGSTPRAELEPLRKKFEAAGLPTEIGG